MQAQTLTKETIKNIGIEDREFPSFAVGDTIEVGIRVKEGEKERKQIFVGDVIAFHNKGIATTFTIRRIGANGVGVERILPYYSPIIESIKRIKKGSVRRSKLFYIRERIGKAARIKEHVVSSKDVKKETKKDVSVENVSVEKTKE